jgi:hypothetical protein
VVPEKASSAEAWTERAQANYAKRRGGMNATEVPLHVRLLLQVVALSLEIKMLKDEVRELKARLAMLAPR